MEDNKEDGSIPFLDTIVKPEPGGTLYITVYRKPTHTDQYIQWDGHHPLLNQSLMAHCTSVCTGNLLILTSTYSGMVTITSQPSSVLSTPSPIGPPQCAAGLSCSKKKRTISRRLSLNANIPNGLWTRWRKDLTSPPDRLLMGAPQVPNLPPMKLPTRVTLSYPKHKVFVKASKRFVVGMAPKPTSKVAEPSRAYWSPPRTKTLWSTKVVPSTGTNVVTKPVMMNT